MFSLRMADDGSGNGPGLDLSSERRKRDADI